jgi:hypothetical protein
MLHRETSWEALAGAVEETLRQGIYQAAGVKQIFENMTGKYLETTPFTPSHYPHLANYKIDRPRVSKFDQLLDRPGVMVH